MPMTVEQLVEEALALPNEARALLVEQLADSLEADSPDQHWHELWAAEVQRRLEEVRSGRVQTIPGDEALAQVRRSLGR